MDPFRLKMRRTHRFDQISSAKSLHPARSFGFASRESVVIHIDHLSRLSALGLDQPGTDVSDAQAFGRRDANGCRVDPVGFGERLSGSIPASSPPSANLDRDACSLKLLIQPPARAVYRCRVSKGCFELQLDLRQQLWPVGEKRLNGLIGFGLVARPTGNHQIADPITSPFGAWMDVINFESGCARGAVCTLMLPLDQQILLNLCFKQGPFLIPLATDLRVLERRRVKAN